MATVTPIVQDVPVGILAGRRRAIYSAEDEELREEKEAIGSDRFLIRARRPGGVLE